MWLHNHIAANTEYLRIQQSIEAWYWKWKLITELPTTRREWMLQPEFSCFAARIWNPNISVTKASCAYLWDNRNHQKSWYAADSRWEPQPSGALELTMPESHGALVWKSFGAGFQCNMHRLPSLKPDSLRFWVSRALMICPAKEKSDRYLPCHVRWPKTAIDSHLWWIQPHDPRSPSRGTRPREKRTWETQMLRAWASV